MSLVRLLKIKQHILEVEEIDILDGTPLLDIKPYVERFDMRSGVRSGWQEKISDGLANLRGKRDYLKE